MGDIQLGFAGMQAAYTRRMALLGGVSILPMAAVFFAAIPSTAYAACPQPVSTSVPGPVYTTADCNFSVTNTGEISGASTGVVNSVSISALSNSGTVAGTFAGIDTYGSILTLGNLGTVAGGGYGVFSSGDTGTLSNSGAIAGGAVGVENAYNIETLSNVTAGTVAGSINGSIGVLNTDLSTIGVIDNGLAGSSVTADTVFGTITGITNEGSTIGQLINNGTISGGTNGVLNEPFSGGELSGIRLSALVSSSPIVGSIATITNTGSITGDSNAIFNKGGYIGTLSNSGTIAGTFEGILQATGGARNSATISTLSNSGLITSSQVGFDNDGATTLGTLINSGTIFGSLYAIVNYFGGSIGAIAQSSGGTITAGAAGLMNFYNSSMTQVTNGLAGGGVTADEIRGNVTGVANRGAFIANLTNNGTITGGSYGVNNNNFTLETISYGTIAVLTNNGSITGAYGVYNASTIGTVANNAGGYISYLDNTSLVGTGNTAIINSGNIGALGNSGTIQGTDYGVENALNATIGTLTNSGTISESANGRFAFDDRGTIGLLTNQSTGVISGQSGGIAIFFGSIGTLANTGTISGAGISGIGIDVGEGLGLTNNASVGTIVNGGTITGSFAAIYADDATTTGTISNSGLIVSKNIGIDNGSVNGGGTIGTLGNTGTISGATYGVENAGGGIIGTLTNSGTIIATVGSGTHVDAISNAGSIGTLTNAQNATIIGANTGITDSGAIGALTNSGRIAGQNYEGINAQDTIGALDNTGTGIITGFYEGIGAGTIGTITNAGLIAGSYYGIYAFGSIGTLANSGDIYSSGFYTGVDVEDGTISVLTNTGTISGAQYGVSDGHSIGTLTNSGTIIGRAAGFINTSSITALLNETSGMLAGSISGSIGVLGTTDLNDPGTIVLLMNGLPGASITADRIFGSITGVANQSIIEALANNGTIYGGKFGIANSYHVPYIDSVINVISAALPQGDTQGSIATLSNTGSIAGVTAGIYNDAGYIGTLTNSGTVSGIYGIQNTSGSVGAGTIATLTNSGLISGSFTGIYNDTSSIGTLTNSGTITGLSGIYNTTGASIITLTNSGSITGFNAAIDNDGSIGTINNAGTIALADIAINNSSGTIGLITNAGIISGLEGVANGGTIGTLSQSAGGTISGTIGVLNEFSGSITQLLNGVEGESGVVLETIFGSTTGVANGGAFIGNLANNGTIAGGRYGIANSLYQYNVESEVALIGLSGSDVQGSISTLTNTGSITGGSTGVYNNGGYIGTLTNSATIIGTTLAGIYNDPSGTIDMAANNAGAIIHGGTSGIHNNGSIGTLTNGGTISGGAFGINGAGNIATLINSGLITGTLTGDNAGSGDTIINQAGGVISGGATGGGIEATAFQTIINQGLIEDAESGAVQVGGRVIVNNSGSISGTEGVQFRFTDSVLTNSGTIISTNGGNAIDFTDPLANFITLTTGSFIQGTIAGGGSSGQITLDGTDNLTSPISNFGTGSALNLDTSADWTASGTWAIASVTNDGSFGPGETANGGVGLPLYLTGNFTQNADGTLLVAVEPDDGTFTTSDFVINGHASLSGTVAFTFAPGTYAPDTHSFLSATEVTGTFTSVHYTNTPSGLTASVLYPDETDPVLQLTNSSTGIVNSGTTTSSTITTPPIITPPVITPPAAAPAFVVRPPDTGIFADELQSSASLAQASNAALLGKAAEGASAASTVCGAEAGVTPAQTTPDKITGVEKLTNAVADAFCGAGGWIQASGTAMDVNGEGAIPGYNADTAGFLAGIDAPVNNAGTRLGLAAGYDETFLADSAAGKGQVDTFRAGIFGSQAVGNFMLAGDFLYGHTSTNTQRVTGIGYAKSSADGNIYSGALQADTLVHLGTLNLIPQAGLRIAGFSANSFAESGVLPAFALTGNGGFYTSVQPFANLDVSSVFLTQSNIAITPDASFGYAYEAGDVGHALIVTSHDGTHFATDYLKLDPNIAELSAGISAGKDSWSFYARYSAALTGNWTSQTGEAGLRIRF